VKRGEGGTKRPEEDGGVCDSRDRDPTYVSSYYINKIGIRSNLKQIKGVNTASMGSKEQWDAKRSHVRGGKTLAKKLLELL